MTRLILSIATVMVLAAGCINPSVPKFYPTISGTQLVFEQLVLQGRDPGGTYRGNRAHLIVLSSSKNQLSKTLEWVRPVDKDKILSVDYSNYVVILAFNGFRELLDRVFTVERIIQTDKAILVIARFNEFIPEATSLITITDNSQYDAVKISKSQITHNGRITFQLVDQTGKVRATATAEVPR